MCVFDNASIDRAAELIGLYNILPRGLGSASERQRFAQDYDLHTALEAALKTLRGEGSHE